MISFDPRTVTQISCLPRIADCIVVLLSTSIETFCFSRVFKSAKVTCANPLLINLQALFFFWFAFSQNRLQCRHLRRTYAFLISSFHRGVMNDSWLYSHRLHKYPVSRRREGRGSFSKEARADHSNAMAHTVLTGRSQCQSSPIITRLLFSVCVYDMRGTAMQ